jgi:hypothetical protein
MGQIALKPQGWKPSQISDCLPYSCGVPDPVAGAACTAAGAYTTYGAPSCLASECAPYRDQIPNCGGQISGSGGTPTISPVPPVPTPPPAPVQISRTSIPAPPPVTTETIQQPLPDLTGSLRPVAPIQQKCSFWCDLNGAIDANPISAVLILLAATVLLWPKGAR